MNTAAPSNVDVDQLVDSLSLEQQVQLLTGADFWRTQAFPEQGIPAIKVTDGPNGARGGIFKDGPSTACFPSAVTVSSTWDTELIQTMGAALGEETKIKGAQVLLAPTVNLHRTVFNGRNFECHSEDPWLASEMAVAYIKGVQSTGVGATIKHFVGNESEYQRMLISSEISERALRELYLLPFERAVKEAGVMCVMTGYNKVGGSYMADNHQLVSKLLRKEWGFDGLVMSDWYAHHNTVDSIKAGCDLEMPGPTRERGDKLLAAVANGQVDRGDIRACARRILELAKRLDRFEDPTLPDERSDDVPSTRTLIRHIGAAGTVLLKNDAALLPLNLKAQHRVAVIGRAATQALIMGGGSANVNAHYRVTPIDALRAACPDVRFEYAAGADIFRYVPVMQQPMTVSYYASEDFSGDVVATQTQPNSEAIWTDNVPVGIDRRGFSATTSLQFTPERDGVYAFSLISAGVSRARLNDDLVIDAWNQWTRGDTYFTWGCDEVVHQRTLKAGEQITIDVEYSTAAPNADKGVFAALRIGAARVLDHTDIDEAVATAAQADTAIVFAGLNAEWDNEGLDRSNIDLPHLQNTLIAQVIAANPRTIVVMQTGSPVLMPWREQAHTIVQAWYPGQECGNAITDVLLGKTDPGGRLPQTWPKQLADTVAYGEPLAYPGVDGQVVYNEELLIGYRHYDAHHIEPAFAFGHGLSYTQFAFEGIHLSTNTCQPGDTVTVSLNVRNTGTRAGSEVVQVYVADHQSTLTRPEKELKAFTKLHLDAGASAQVTLTLNMRSFAAFDAVRHGWLAQAGRFDICVARSATNIIERHTLTLANDWSEPV